MFAVHKGSSRPDLPGSPRFGDRFTRLAAVSGTVSGK
jgi:hypothetical protein